MTTPTPIPTLAQQFAAEYAKSAVPAMLRAIRNVKRASRLILAGGLAISYTHQGRFLTGLPDVGAFGWAIPGLFDLGMIAMIVVTQAVGMHPEAKKAAAKVLVALVAASASVNVLAAATWVTRGVFATVVVLIAAIEWVGSKMRPDFTAIEAREVETTTAATPTRKLDPAVAKQRAAKARITREANRLAKLTPAQRGALTRKAKAHDTELVDMAAGYVPSNAPVSPALV